MAEDLIKKVKETVHREKDEAQGKMKPEGEHAQEKTREAGQDVKEGVKKVTEKLT